MLFGMVSVAGKVTTLAVFGVRLNVVLLFMRRPVPADDVWRTLKLNVGPLMLVGKLKSCQLDCATFVPTVTGR